MEEVTAPLRPAGNRRIPVTFDGPRPPVSKPIPPVTPQKRGVRREDGSAHDSLSPEVLQALADADT